MRFDIQKPKKKKKIEFFNKLVKPQVSEVVAIPQIYADLIQYKESIQTIHG